MFKFLLFQGDNHYPRGGMDDLVLKFNTYEEFYEQYDYKMVDWYQLVNTSDFSWEEFTTKIIWKIDGHNYTESRKKIMQQRKEEFNNWISEQLSK